MSLLEPLHEKEIMPVRKREHDADVRASSACVNVHAELVIVRKCFAQMMCSTSCIAFK